MSKEKHEKNWFSRNKFLTVVIAVIILAAIGAATGQSGSAPSKSSQQNNQPQGQSAQKAPSKKSSQEIFDQTQVGMTKDQVVQLAGRGPDNCTDSEIAGLGTTSICSWGTASVTFSDGKVSSKTKL